MTNRYIITVAASLLLAAPLAQAEQSIDRSLATNATPKVEISNVQGRVSISAWDRNEVKVTGTLRNDKDEFEFSGDAGRVVIKVRPESRTFDFGRGRDALLNINVPKGARLEVHTVSADIGVDGVNGEQRLESVSGDVRTTVQDEPLDLRTISGDASITGAGGKAAVFAESTSGNVLARGLGATLEAKTVSGDLDVELGTTSMVRAETVSGDLRAVLTLAEAGRIDAQSISGDVNLRFGQPVNGEFDVESFSGDIENCFGPKPGRKSKYGPGTELRFTQGSDSGRIKVQTLSGDVALCDH